MLKKGISRLLLGVTPPYGLSGDCSGLHAGSPEHCHLRHVPRGGDGAEVRAGSLRPAIVDVRGSGEGAGMHVGSLRAAVVVAFGVAGVLKMARAAPAALAPPSSSSAEVERAPGYKQTAIAP
jgi:hypothetical protein